MLRKQGFTLIELLVVISIIALLLAILMPALGMTKKMAQSVICRTNLHQWYLSVDMYANDNEDTFWQGWLTAPGDDVHNWWMIALRPYYNDLVKMRICPSAKRTRFLEDGSTPGPGRQPFMAWGYNTWLSANSPEREDNGDLVDYYGSYAINGWLLNAYKVPDNPGINAPKYWRKTSRFVKPYNIPFMVDAQWIDCWPEPASTPPLAEDDPWSNFSHMTRIVQNRHMKKENAGFMDGTARTVGLKQLWVLDWHRTYDIKGPWTVAGGADYALWDSFGNGWMASFKDY